MNDLISRQEAIEAIEKESQVDGAYGYMDTKSIIDLLNDMPSAQPEPQWIPCSERLPKVKEVVLIYVYYEFIDIGWMRSDGNWDTQFGVYDKRNITHWTPLPKPPKGEEDG